MAASGDMVLAGDQGFDMTIIEVMLAGDIGNEKRVDQYMPYYKYGRRPIGSPFSTLTFSTPGPARYVRSKPSQIRLIAIDP